MIRRRRPVRFVRALAAVLAAIAIVLPASASAAGDVTPPTGTVELWNMDNETQLAELRLSYSDPESGIDHLLVVCDGGPEFTVPYATTLFWPMHDGTGGCSTAYGEHSILIQAYNGDGLSSNAAFSNPSNGPTLHVTVSTAPTTGHQVTITPVFSADYVIPAGALCRWEFRWGTDEALDETFTGETFGGLLFDIRAASGGCGPWTFTLPWVPYRQFDVRIDLGQQESDGGVVFGPGAATRFTAASDGTDRRITSSNLPIAQVLPSTYAPIVGQPITYTRYLVGGASACCNASWFARLGPGENPVVFTQEGGTTFTFTPSITGDVFVGWQRTSSTGLQLAGYYDPPVRRRDSTPPTTTVPAERIRTGNGSSLVPLSVSWIGADVGWGIASYQLQKSVNGGAWTGVTLSSARATSAGVSAAAGSTIRFRVRAKDKAGHLGSWKTGALLHVVRVADTSSNLRTSPSWKPAVDAGAYGGSVVASKGSGATAIYTFSGRDVAWIASRGPDHGKAKVYVDGALATTIDLYAASPEARRIVYAKHFALLGTHRLKVVVQATATRPWVDIDGFFRLS